MTMAFSYLASLHQSWRDILVIDRTIERDGKRYYILGMTLEGATLPWKGTLYIIEPYKAYRRKMGVCSHRIGLRELFKTQPYYQDVQEIHLGKSKLRICGHGHECLQRRADAHAVELFFDMMRAGWTVPEWLSGQDWEDLQLVTLMIADIERLPEYTSDMPIVIKHRATDVGHIVEKNVTLTVGKSRSFRFIDHCGDEVWCHINNVHLIDMWEQAEMTYSPEALQALEHLCPQGMRFIGIEYECSKDISLQFYTKDYLKAFPKAYSYSGNGWHFFQIPFKWDKEIGLHHLPLKGAAISTPVAADTVKIPAELFSYYEKVPAWEETV